MSHITPCEVRVKDSEQREELKKWLVSLHYRIILHTTKPLKNGEAYFVGERVLVNAPQSTWEHGHDCGTNIELFKELARMTDSVDDGRNWFTDGNGEWARHQNIEFSDGRVFNGHKATSEEIIADFKNIPR